MDHSRPRHGVHFVQRIRRRDFLPVVVIVALRDRAPILTAWLSLLSLQEWLSELGRTSDEVKIYRTFSRAADLYAIGTVVGLAVVLMTVAFAT